MQSSFRLRPMDLRDILDDTFDLFKENFILFVTITALVFLPFNLFIHLIVGAAPAVDPQSRNPADFASVGIPIFLTVILGTLATYIAMGALSVAVSERYLGRTVTFQEAYSSIMRRFGAFAFTLILPFIIAIVGSMILFTLPILLGVGLSLISPVLGILVGLVVGIAAIIAAIYLWFSLSFIIPAFVIEGHSGMAAFKRSIQLFTYNTGKALLTLFLVSFIVVILQAVVTGPISGIAGLFAASGGGAAPLFAALQGIVSGIAQTLFQPIQIIVILLLYYDIRIRREGFDLEMMANDLQSSLGREGIAREDTTPLYSEDKNSDSRL